MSGYLQDESKLQFFLHINRYFRYKPIPLLCSCLNWYSCNSILKKQNEEMRPSSLLNVHKCHKGSQMPHIPNTQTLPYTVFVISYLPLLSPKPCTYNETYFLADNFCIYNFGTEFSMHTKQIRSFLWFLTRLFTETKDKIIVTQCWDHFMFLHQLSKGRSVEWRILTSLLPCPGESFFDLHQTQRERKETILRTWHTDPVIVPHSKPTKQHKHTQKKTKIQQALWTEKLL